jgi:hypothetical protein
LEYCEYDFLLDEVVLTAITVELGQETVLFYYH